MAKLAICRAKDTTILEINKKYRTTAIPTSSRRPCLMQDHQYRLGVVAQTMGYYYPAQLSK